MFQAYQVVAFNEETGEVTYPQEVVIAKSEQQARDSVVLNLGKQGVTDLTSVKVVVHPLGLPN